MTVPHLRNFYRYIGDVLRSYDTSNDLLIG